MDNSRRPFDRSREPGLKKPRLVEESVPSPIGRHFTQRPVVSATATRFQSGDSDSGDLSRISAYEPQPLPPQKLHEELLSQYKMALAELTFNSKPIITNLTIIAGENLQAAKAIAAIVCANILEVPSDQKLPSLYLLDSIVKNIGRDYIRYFAAKLPEVFCKAYRQVDPSVHSSMRHLFGTWKGVFPPQTLQIIEKELAFASMVNGSSGTTSRTDTHSQRPPHSIHVNPKYLERQQLQQSSRAKVMVNKMSGAISNSEVDAERPERTTTISSGHPWVDPSVKMRSIQRSHREPLSEPFNEKGAVYGDYEYVSGLPQNSGIASGRTSGRIGIQAHDRPIYAVGNSVAETVSSQRNGLNAKPVFPNYLASKSSNIDGHPLPTKGAASKSNSLLSSSWKNSEEEEFMWDTHSRGLDHDTPSIANNSKKDRWTPDVSENLDFSSLLHEPEAVLDAYSLSNEQKDQTASGIRIESEWLSSGLHKKDRLTHSGNSTINSVHLEGYSGTHGRLPMTANSLVKTGTRQQVGSSNLHLSGSAILANVAGPSETLARHRFLPREAASPSGQSPMRQRSPSPSFQTRDPRKQLQYLVEREYPQGPQPDAKPSQQSRCLNAGPNKHYSYSHPLQLETLEPEPSGHNKKLLLSGISESGPAMKADNVSEYSAPVAVETTKQLNTSSLLADVMKSGILSNSIATSTVPGRELIDGGKLPSRSGGLAPVSFASTGTKVESATLLEPVSHDSKLDTINKPEDKVEHPTLPSGLPPSSQIGDASPQTSNVESKAVNPLSNLLSSLVAKGLISASKTESQSSVAHKLPTQIQNKSPDDSSSSSPPVSSVPFSSETNSSAADEISFGEPAAKSSATFVDYDEKELDNLIGLEFRSDVIREFHPSVIRSLSEDLPHQCSLCGIRLKLQERLDRHLEWHAMKRPEQSGVGSSSRRWYVRSGDWVSGNVGDSGFESCGSLDEPEKTTEQSELMVPVDENQCACILCGELFEDYFNQERNEWMFKGAVYLTVQLKDGELGTTDVGAANGPIVHENCLSESSVHDLGLAGAAKVEV